MRENYCVAFLLGVPRSGTTLLSVLLDQHPSIHSPPEPWLLLGLDALGQVPCEHFADPPLVADAIDEFLGGGRANFLKEAALPIYQQALRQSGKSVFIDKTPRYYHVLDLVKSFIPDSKIILLLRNPLDVAASFKTSWAVDLPDLIAERSDSPFLFDYILGFNQLLEFSESNPVLKVYYENLVTNPNRQMQRIFEYLGLAQQPISAKLNLEAAAYIDTSAGDKKISNTRRVHAKSIDTYNSVFSARELSILGGALGEECFGRLGYRKQYASACQEIETTPSREVCGELLLMAKQYATQRRAQCAFPQSQGRLEADNNILNQQLEAAREQQVNLNQQFEAVNAAQADLSQKLQSVNAEKENLSDRLIEIQNMGFRDRVRSDLRYGKKRLRQVVDFVLWRIVNGPDKGAPPRITLVTPVLNGGELIEATLRSVLSQDYSDLEYIVVDGGSTDDTLQTIEHVCDDAALPNKITKLISEPDEGMYDAIAKGFSKATGDVLGYLNADDLLEAGALASIGGYFSANPKINVIYHEDAVLVDGWKYPNVRQPRGISTTDLLNKHILYQDGVFFRRSAYEAVGGLRRDLKLAGDYDLWLRLSLRNRFVRRPGHVSCFRMRPGQLSTDMESYYREMDRARLDFLATRSQAQKFLFRISSTFRPLRKLLRAGRLNRNRLFFPMDFGNLPPPQVSLSGPEFGNARSPIDGKPAERLLFSAPDTRFGEDQMHHIYLDTRHEVAITYPPIDPEKLNALYRKHYSSPPAEIKHPNGASPYRLYNRRRIWEKALLRLPVATLARVFSNGWADNTLAELKLTLKSSRVDMTRCLRFLDVGCFEGNLLDQIGEHTPWQAQGLEPNENAVEIARGKGHKVWQGHAEDAIDIFPESVGFDVIFMGQNIEHLDSPLLVLRKLRLLLAPGGVLVVSTPNLGSREIDWFGPTWAHWHPPYHRYIFSRKGLIALAQHAGLKPICFRSFSHCYWTAMSITQNFLGLGGSVSHAVSIDRGICVRAQRIHFWKQLLWNRVGKGDFCFLSMSDGAYE